MINELTVLRALQDTIKVYINEYIKNGIDKISEKSIILDFPDIDKMNNSNVFYIQPNESEYANLSTESDTSIFYVSVFILSKRDKSENLTIKIYEYFNALYSLLKDNISLDGVVDFVDINSAEYYPSVEGNTNIKGIEVSVGIRYTKEFK